MPEKEKKGKEEELKELLEKKKEEKVDEEALGKIIDRMSDKYKEEGILKEGEAPEKTREMRKLMRGERTYEVGEASASQLESFENPLVSFFGKLYTAFEAPLHKVEDFLEGRAGRRLEDNLKAARMKYSVEQYLALTLIALIVATVSVFGLFMVLSLIGAVPFIFTVLFTLLTPFVVLGLAFILPRNKAKKIGNEVEKELPFALRHMSIEIRAGVGIYETMESIASSDYGRLSEGFQEVLSDIEKGVSTEDALEAWAARTKSQPVKRVVSHIVRALRTGGSLSDVMVEIAEDVSFQRRQKITDFSEKLNLVGLFLMMSAIVFPIMIAILTTIGSTPQIQKYLGFFSMFSPVFLMFVFFFIVPSLLGLFMYYIKASDPGTI